MPGSMRSRGYSALGYTEKNIIMFADDLNIAYQLSSRLFSDSFEEARNKFIEAAPDAKAYQSSGKGPSGECLSTDVAFFGPLDALNILVLVSGTHGVEGYCGSAAQLLFLQAKLQEQLPPSSAVLFIHALNAHGFAWDRRITREGCDLNRNFVDFSQPLPNNEGFKELAEHLVPTDSSPEGLRRAEKAIAAYRASHGEAKFQQSRMAGQYTHPGSAYYGGSGPTEARTILEQIGVDYELGSRRQVLVIDYHTGEGPYGYGDLQCEEPSGAGGYKRAREMFGPSVTSPDVGSLTSVAIMGCQDEYWERLLGERHTYLALEFGTFSTDCAREAVRGDHWLYMYHPEELNSELGRSIRAKTKKHFYPQERGWEEMVIWRSHQVHRRAVEVFG